MATFALGEVTLGDGIFAHSHAVNLRYLAVLDVDRLLAPMRIEAGLEPHAEKYPNWESMGLDGHTAGHYLSALAQEAAQGHSGMRQRLETMVAGMAEIQRAYGDGYVGGVPDSRELWHKVAAGEFDATGFSINGRWVPFYNLHKTFAGLRDAWLLAGSAQAREVLVGFADWADRLVADLDEEQMQRLLEAEHGGMNEVLADTYAITGERRYLRLARRFSHRAILDPLLRREDALDGLHANTQIPKVIGFARIGELDHDREWMDAAAFFWDRVAQHRSIAFGGNSVREHFNPLDDFSAMTISPEGPETCNSYNMLKLTLLLHRLDPQAGHADFYERVLFNHILSTQHPDHGGLVYFTPVRARHYRVYSQPQECFWCCVGSGIENHGRHTAFTYACHDGALAVNLYMASQLHWRERGLTLTQETAFPYQPASALHLSMERPQPFTLKLRHPHWLEGPLSVRINGKPWPLESVPGSYAAIARTWSDRDRVEIELPMRTRIEGLPDGSDQVAVMHGPVLLAARTGSEDLDGLIADDGRGSHIAPGPHMPLDRAPMLVGDRERLADGIVAVAGEPLVFSAEALIRPQGFRGLRLEPFHRVHDSRYMAYWRTTTAAAYPALLARIEADERERQAIEQRTLDRIQPGEQQPEVEHAFQGEDSRSGLHFGRHWRDTGKWMSYRLTVPAGTPADQGMTLTLTFYGGDRNEGFDLHANGRLLETVALSGDAKDRFVDYVIALPAPVAAGAAEGVTLKLSAAQGRRTARLFDVRLLRQAAPR
ncbi:beta-L-arabinofuranosidase domain-containing protein [Pseudoxanthomonas wuyuanensis]